MMTNKNYKIDLAKLLDKKLMFEFAKEMLFDEKASGNESTWDKVGCLNLLSQLLGFPHFLPENSNELCDKRKFISTRETS